MSARKFVDDLLFDDEDVPPAPAKRRRSRGPVRIEVGARSCWGYGGGLADLLDEIGSPRMWDPFRSTGRRKVITFPINRCDDLLALVEHRKRRLVQLTAVDR